MEEILYDTGSLIKAYKKRKRLMGYTTILNVVEFPKLLELKLTVIYPSNTLQSPIIRSQSNYQRIY